MGLKAGQNCVVEISRSSARRRSRLFEWGFNPMDEENPLSNWRHRDRCGPPGGESQ